MEDESLRKNTILMLNILENTAVKEFNRMTKMSWRFSLHCITMVTCQRMTEITKISSNIFACHSSKKILSYIVPEKLYITHSRLVVLREVISPKPGGVEEDKDDCKEDLEHILHHEHGVEETRVSEMMKNKKS